VLPGQSAGVRWAAIEVSASSGGDCCVRHSRLMAFGGPSSSWDLFLRDVVYRIVVMISREICILTLVLAGRAALGYEFRADPSSAAGGRGGGQAAALRTSYLYISRSSRRDALPRSRRACHAGLGPSAKLTLIRRAAISRTSSSGGYRSRPS